MVKIVSIFLLLTCLMLQSCQPSEREVEIAFYHWQTELKLTHIERDLLHRLESHHLYVKFFDIDWDVTYQEAIPLASVQIDTLSIRALEIVPTVFITNRTFQQLDEAGVDTLAQRVHRRLYQLGASLPQAYFSEIQMDCDWTESTRDRYFRFLEKFKLLLSENTLLSTTIRLHQVQYREQTGIPPVDRGILMCYNVGELEDWQEENSILQAQTAAPYLKRLRQYPLSLDLALPIFSWGVLFRDNRMIRLINGLRADDLQDRERFRQLADNRFQVIKSTYLRGYYLYKEDLLRLESVPMFELEASARILSASWPENTFKLAFYHLDTATIKHYSYEQLEAIRMEMVQP